MIHLVTSFLLVWFAGGATCQRRGAVSEFDPPPAVFADAPSLEELVAAINRGDTIQKLQTTSATVELLDVSLPVSRLSATLALERPRRLSLRADLPILPGPGFDLGSNEEMFWMRYPEGMQYMLLFARHDEFQHQMAGSPLPVDPTWIIDALGLVHLDPALVMGEPTVMGDGKLELKARIPTPSGQYTRVLVVDAEAGFVHHQFLYGPDGALVAKASGSNFRYYENEKVVLPHTVQLQIQPQGAPPIALRIEIGGYALNQLLGSDPGMFELPRDGSETVVDLSKLRAVLPPAGTAPPPGTAPPEGASTPYKPPGPQQVSTGPQYVPTASYTPTYRGTQLR